jgi:predicted double-glycine peptidase
MHAPRGRIADPARGNDAAAAALKAAWRVRPGLLRRCRAGLFLVSLCAGLWMGSPWSGVARAASLPLPDVQGALLSVPVASVSERRFWATIRQKYDYSCGSASLATLLTYQYGIKVNEDEAFREMFARGDQPKIRREGFSLLDIKHYLEAHGFQADGFELPLDKLEQAHVPAIVLIRESGYNHFVVIKGLMKGRVLIGDPSVGTRVLGRGAFETAWTSHILFVIRDHQAMARFNAPTDWAVAPLSPIAEGLAHGGLEGLVMPKFGPGEF